MHHTRQASVVYNRGYPATVNHKLQADLAAEAAVAVVGEAKVHRDISPTMGAEDFSYSTLVDAHDVSPSCIAFFWFCGCALLKIGHTCIYSNTTGGRRLVYKFLLFKLILFPPLLSSPPPHPQPPNTHSSSPLGVLLERPGCYVFLGGAGGPSSCMVHNPSLNPKYDFNDSIPPVGASWFAEVVESRMPLN